MSGGVDSSVTARLLADQDYDLSAVYMRNWDTRDESGTDRGCEWEKDWEDVQRVCRMLDIPCHLIDLSREYWNRIFQPSLYQWEMGVTPNPDVWCNREIKFGALLERLQNDNSHLKPWFATGHYARKDWFGPPSKRRPRLLRGVDRNKDQSYYLSSISEAGLGRALFPLGHLTKPEVRKLAKKYQLPTAERSESMGICFVGEKTKFSKFLSSYIPTNPGPIYDISTNKLLGQHAGLWNYTIGENARIGGMPARMFVTRKDSTSNAIYVAPGTENSALYCTSISVANYRWIWADEAPEAISASPGFRARIMYRYRMSDVPCTVFIQGDPSNLLIKFNEPQKAVSPGQVAALWDGDWCLGCGIIAYTSFEQ
ncbi:tRNA-specific 2-thiouridylase [Amanita muscaria]